MLRYLRWLLALMFVMAGITKLVGVEAAVTGFEHFGYPPWFRLLIGALETAGGVGLLLPMLARPAAAGLLGIMIGAVWTLVRAGEPPLPPIVVGALLGVVAARPTEA